MWIPTTEAELVTAAESNSLIEGTYLELKRDLARGTGANKELARDLASLAVSGGVLVFGIVDQDDRDPGAPGSALAPLPLDGLVERIEQVALTRCDPPLFVRCITIETARETSSGYLVVHVPPSEVAPHMVDGKYWGRSNVTKRQLTDSDVVTLHERRRLSDRDAADALESYVKRDPVIEAGRIAEFAHLFVVAEPRPGRQGMLLDVLSGQQNWQPYFHTLLHNTTSRHSRSDWAPDISWATTWSTRADGWAATTSDLGPGRVLSKDADEDHLLEIELAESGVCRLFCGRASFVPYPERAPDFQVIFERLIAGLTNALVSIASSVSQETDYHGAWALGVALTGTKGKSSHLIREQVMQGSPYPDDSYLSLTRASTQELQMAPGAVTERLLGRMLRTLGSHSHSPLDEYLGRDGSSRKAR